MYSNSCGYNIYYEISGNTEGEWLILLHGLSASTKCWKYQINELNKHFRVLNIDLAGHGNSGTHAAEKYGGEIIANHIRILLDELNIEKVNILGISLGTIVQQYFCEMFPERVISSVLTSPINKTIMKNSVQKIVLKLFGKNAFFLICTHLSLPGEIHKSSRKFIIRESKKISATELLKWWQIALKEDHFKYISTCKIPTLIIVGDKDYRYYKEAFTLNKKYINSEIREIKDVGHVLIFQKPDEFNKIVIDFFRSARKKRMKLTSLQ